MAEIKYPCCHGSTCFWLPWIKHTHDVKVKWLVNTYLWLGFLLMDSTRTHWRQKSSLSPFFFFLFFSPFELPNTILFNPRLGSDCSATPSSLSFSTPPHNNWYSWLLILHDYFKGRMQDQMEREAGSQLESSPTIVNDVHSVENY